MLSLAHHREDDSDDIPDEHRFDRPHALLQNVDIQLRRFRVVEKENTVMHTTILENAVGENVVAVGAGIEEEEPYEDLVKARLEVGSDETAVLAYRQSRTSSILHQLPQVVYSPILVCTVPKALQEDMRSHSPWVSGKDGRCPCGHPAMTYEW